MLYSFGEGTFVTTMLRLSPTTARKMQPQGFSLVEVLVVVMVLLVIAAIAIPSMLQARMRANEGAAIASIRAIQAAQTIYFDDYPKVGFAASLADLGSHGSNCETPGPSNACIITDDALASGLKSGYMFEVVNDGNTPSMAYTVTAAPETAGSTGHCAYASSQIGGVQVQSPKSDGGRFDLSTSGCQ